MLFQTSLFSIFYSTYDINILNHNFVSTARTPLVAGWRICSLIYRVGMGLSCWC